ncbi:MAG: serine/threonine protein phosphatase [Rhodospirillales bacterium]|nr:MAG: serine/threonine protein phosphatase [Rhodospirillales bacterium]
MFGWFRASPQPTPSTARAPDGRVVYAIGDIHGRADLLERLLARIVEDAEETAGDAARVLVFVGDYVDRGMESRQVLERLVAGVPDGFEPVFLLGNHEEAFLGFLDGGVVAFDWFRFGGLETLYSYGVGVPRPPVDPEDVDAIRARLVAAVPPEHVAFMRACKLTHSEGDYLFAHAGIRPGVPLDKQDPDDLLWIRDEFLHSRDPHGGRVVVHGHTVTDEPEVRFNRIGIDTGAYVSGHLTCVVLSGADRRFIAT